MSWKVEMLINEPAGAKMRSALGWQISENWKGKSLGRDCRLELEGACTERVSGPLAGTSSGMHTKLLRAISLRMGSRKKESSCPCMLKERMIANPLHHEQGRLSRRSSWCCLQQSEVSTAWKSTSSWGKCSRNGLRCIANDGCCLFLPYLYENMKYCCENLLVWCWPRPRPLQGAGASPLKDIGNEPRSSPPLLSIDGQSKISNDIPHAGMSSMIFMERVEGSSRGSN